MQQEKIFLRTGVRLIDFAARNAGQIKTGRLRESGPNQREKKQRYRYNCPASRLFPAISPSALIRGHSR
jgi:hypothetical protein